MYAKEVKATHSHRYKGTNVRLLTRTSWFDANVALSQIEKGKASGNKSALWLRAKLQVHFFDLGCFVQQNAGKVLFVGLLALITFCVGLKSATIETSVEKLWVEEDGRLEKELKYMRTTLGEGFGSTNQLIIQTPKSSDNNILHPNALLHHLEVMKVATQVTVDMFEVTWRLKDICYSPSIPSFEEYHIDKILEELFPCAIITPLDCFWEGAKILGPEYPIAVPGLALGVKWTNLNPQFMVEMMKEMEKQRSSQFPYLTLQEIMKRAGIATAYQEKPCLNPNDTECPNTAPNKHSHQLPDVGYELTGGCYGFAAKLMHWPEDLIVGGVKKNKTGHIVKAKALQSVIQLMAEQEMFEYWQNDYKVHNIDWSLEKGRQVLEAWQRKFSEDVLKFSGIIDLEEIRPSRGYNVHLFTSTLLMDIMKNFSDINLTKVGLGYLLMLVYAGAVLTKWTDGLTSQSFLGVAGVCLVALSIAAGLGFCALIGLPFNASTTQIIPFLALGLGVDALFLLVNTYSENLKMDTHFDDTTGECLKQIGSNILLTALCSICGFLAAAIIPIPALRAFVLQAAVLVTFSAASVLLLFPAIASLDLRRQRSRRMDLFCCFSMNDEVCESHEKAKLRETVVNNNLNVEQKKKCDVHALSSEGNNVITSLLSYSSADSKLESKSASEPFLPLKRNDKVYCDCEEGIGSGDGCVSPKDSTTEPMSLNYFVEKVYGPLLQRKAFKVLVIFVFVVILLTCLSGIPRVSDGLDLTDIVPRDTVEYKFLSVQTKYFSFFNMFAVTQGNFEYPTNQRLLHEYHHAFTRIGKIIKNDDGGLPEFWLTMFRDWLMGLQQAFDTDTKNGCITQEGWFANASDDGILAYKLLVQTGRVDNPVDKSLVTKVKLVDESGIINSKAFYNYLTAWVSNDALAYSSSQASLRPEPRQWIHVARDFELKIPKSQPLVYTQVPFYLNRMASTEDITATIQEIRTICQKYEDKGLPNFPTGIPFVYWEQYVRLRFYLLSAIVVVLASVFLVICIFLFNPWAASLVTVLLTLIVAQLFGIMGLLDIRLSAVPAVILIIAVGIGANFLLHLTLSFLTTIGKRNHRMKVALEHMFAPLTHGLVSTLFGVGMLAFSEFDFIIRYFFCVLCGLVILGGLYGLLLLPVLLSMIGPPSEIVPFEHKDRISTPTPSPSPPIQRKLRNAPSGHYFSRRNYPRVQSEISLSTISEEPQSYHSSHEIVVQPELVVETTTVTTGQNCCSQTTTTSAPGNEKATVESPTPSMDRETPESPLSRDSPASMSDSSSGASSMSRSSSVTGHITPNLLHPQTVTTKVTATAKLKVEVHAPFLDHPRDYAASSTNRNRHRDRDRERDRDRDKDSERYYYRRSNR